MEMTFKEVLNSFDKIDGIFLMSLIFLYGNAALNVMNFFNIQRGSTPLGMSILILFYLIPVSLLSFLGLFIWGNSFNSQKKRKFKRKTKGKHE